MNVDVPKDPEATKIRIEGPTEGVLKAKAEIDAMIRKLKDEVSADVAIEQRFHRQIIGKSGESIKEVCGQYGRTLSLSPYCLAHARYVMVTPDREATVVLK